MRLGWLDKYNLSVLPLTTLIPYTTSENYKYIKTRRDTLLTKEIKIENCAFVNTVFCQTLRKTSQVFLATTGKICMALVVNEFTLPFISNVLEAFKVFIVSPFVLLHFSLPLSVHSLSWKPITIQWDICISSLRWKSGMCEMEEEKAKNRWIILWWPLNLMNYFFSAFVMLSKAFINCEDVFAHIVLLQLNFSISNLPSKNLILSRHAESPNFKGWIEVWLTAICLEQREWGSYDAVIIITFMQK